MCLSVCVNIHCLCKHLQGGQNKVIQFKYAASAWSLRKSFTRLYHHPLHGSCWENKCTVLSETASHIWKSSISGPQFCLITRAVIKAFSTQLKWKQMTCQHTSGLQRYMYISFENNLPFKIIFLGCTCKCYHVCKGNRCWQKVTTDRFALNLKTTWGLLRDSAYLYCNDTLWYIECYTINHT